MKRCSKCNKIKPKSKFGIDRNGNDGLRPDCRYCRKLANFKQRRLQRDRRLESEYGMLPGQYEMMLKSQNNKCAICKKLCPPERNLAIDHCHKTNKVRGLLCMNCNTSLGWLEKYNPQQYLEIA